MDYDCDTRVLALADVELCWFHCGIADGRSIDLDG